MRRTRAAKTKEAATAPAVDKLLHAHWHKSVTYAWTWIAAPRGTVEEQTARLADIYAEQRGKPLG